MADPAALDADHAPASAGQRGVEAEDDHDRTPLPFRGGVGVGAVEVARGRWPPPPAPPPKGRSEARRVGPAGHRTGDSRGSPDPLTNTTIQYTPSHNVDN